MPKCPLCREREGTLKSHILPDFLYRASYDDKHQLIVFDQESQRRGTRFSAHWEQLFCIECEARFGRWETYFADIWFNRPLRPRRLEGEFVGIRGLDYSRFKLFHLSVLWRAGVSGLSAFAQVSLGPHGERIRHLLLTGNPGEPTRYPIAGRALSDDDGSFKDDIVSLPAPARIDGHYVYRMLYGGVFWYCCVSNRRIGCPVPLTLHTDGTLTLFVERWTSDPAILSVAADVQRFEARRRTP